MENNKLKRNLEFLFEIGSMKNVPRGWRQHLGMKVANNLEHSFRVVWIAIIIARMEGLKNEEKIIKMALTHDLPEARTSDLSYIQKMYVKADEAQAGQDMFQQTSLEDFYNDILSEYEERQSLESKIVKDADNLDIEFELKELAEQGSKLPDKWKKFRRLVRNEKLYTNSAKKIWDEIQTSDVSSWHLAANKWVKDPNAGK